MSNNKDAGVRSIYELREFAQNLDYAQKQLIDVYRWLNDAIDSVCQTWDDKQLAAFKPEFEAKADAIDDLSRMVEDMSDYVKKLSDKYEEAQNVKMRKR